MVDGYAIIIHRRGENPSNTREMQIMEVLARDPKGRPRVYRLTAEENVANEYYEDRLDRGDNIPDAVAATKAVFPDIVTGHFEAKLSE